MSISKTQALANSKLYTNKYAVYCKEALTNFNIWKPNFWFEFKKNKYMETLSIWMI